MYIHRCIIVAYPSYACVCVYVQASPAGRVSRVWPHVQEQQSSQRPHASPWRLRLDKEGELREGERERGEVGVLTCIHLREKGWGERVNTICMLWPICVAGGLGRGWRWGVNEGISRPIA